MRVLITGVGGFVGRYLAAHLLEAGDEVWGLTRSGSADRMNPRVRLLAADLMDRGQVDATLAEARPEAIYHLAAESSVARSLKDPLAILLNNVVGQVNLLEAVAAAGLGPRILIVGSGEEYGPSRPDELPIAETKELRPISPYGVSKAAQGLLGHQYFATRGQKIVRVRPFTHIGPGQSSTFVTASFARQIAEMEAGRREPLMRVGYLEGQRDFTDVRDVVRGYRLLLHYGALGDVYNLASGRPRSVRSILDALLARSTARPRVETDPTLIRPTEMPINYADCSKILAATGWRPEIPIEQTLADILEYWRERVQGDDVDG